MKNLFLYTALVIVMFSNTLLVAQTNTPCGATALTPAATCTSTSGTTAGATYQNNAANGNTPSCASPGAPDVWYSFVAPASGNVTIQTTSGSITDGGMALYSGACGGLTEVSCDDDSGPGLMPQIAASGLTAGATYYIRFWQYGGSGTGTFNICITAGAASGAPGGTNCNSQSPICSGSPISFTANTGSPAASTVNPGNNYGCLFTSPNPSWYYLEIANGGNLVVDISAGSDVDFAIWGPFPSVAAGNAACNSYTAPSDCSYSTAAVEQVNINGVVTGQVYVLLVTNYANTVQTINVTNGGGTATTNCAIVPLPVGFSDWQAYLATDKVRMTWKTESETNSDFFAVQRSNDGMIWTTIGFVDAAGNSTSTETYAFTDNKPNEGINYYRLKQVDQDGNSMMTTVIAVEYNVISTLDAYPNPTTGLVLLKEKDFSIKSVQLIDLTGRAWELPFSKANTGVSVDMSTHAKGTYTLRSIDEQGNLHSTLLILE